MIDVEPSNSEENEGCGYPEDSDFGWTYKGAVSDVRFAGVCGASWAFATVAALETSHFIKNNEMLDLSEQQIIDCDTASKGCSSGSVENALNYAKANSLMVEADYPYKGELKIFDPSCKYD